ncbi:MAG: glycosyltransferase family 4 protein [Planctomycetaceae bacterium]
MQSPHSSLEKVRRLSPPDREQAMGSSIRGSVRRRRILMLLENESYPDDTRVGLEARSLQGAGYEVTVICPTGDRRTKHEVIDGVRIYRYPRPWAIGGFVGYFLEYAYSMAVAFVVSLFVLLRHGFDAVHVHAPPDMNALIARCYQLLGKRFVLDLHDLSPELYQAQRNGRGNRTVHRALLWFERFACRSADRLIATNESQRNVQIHRAGVDPGRCYVVRNGPGAKFLLPVSGLEEFRDSGRTIIGYVGMIGVQDGLDCLMRTLADLRYRLGREDFLAVIVGSGPAWESVRRLSKELKLEDCVRFTGYVSGHPLLQHIASFDICVTPDPSNPYNDSCTTVKTMEYMAMGKPTVAFDLPENRCTAGEAALYASGNNEAELALRIRELMDDPERREAIGHIARDRVQRHFMWEMQAPRLLELYQGLLTNDGVNVRDEPIEKRIVGDRFARTASTSAT